MLWNWKSPTSEKFHPTQIVKCAFWKHVEVTVVQYVQDLQHPQMKLNINRSGSWVTTESVFFSGVYSAQNIVPRSLEIVEIDLHRDSRCQDHVDQLAFKKHHRINLLNMTGSSAKHATRRLDSLEQPETMENKLEVFVFCSPGLSTSTLHEPSHQELL